MANTRRTFLQTIVVGGTAYAANSSPAFAQKFQESADPPTPLLEKSKMAPDFQTRLGPKIVGVDIDLLGPNGELTVAFVASLDTHHGEDWKKLPEERLASQDPFRIHEFLSHMEGHDINARDVERIYALAKQEWKKKYIPEPPEKKPKTP